MNRVRLLIGTFAVVLLMPGGSVCYADAVLTTDPSGFTSEVTLFCQGCSPPIFRESPFTDANGNTATINSNLDGLFAWVSGLDVFTATFKVTFAHPVLKAGFDILAPDGSTQSPFQLSNGDSTASSSCNSPSGQCFLGVTDNTPFTSFSTMVKTPVVGIPSFTEILDFRYTPASAVPEPSSVTLVAPLLIAGFAALRLKRRAK